MFHMSRSVKQLQKVFLDLGKIFLDKRSIILEES